MARSPSGKSYRKPALVRSIRVARSWHAYLGIVLGLLLFVSAVSGLLLGWKKNSEWLQPSTQRGTQGELSEWRNLAELQDAALVRFRETYGQDAPADVDRMDVRPGKNVVKVRFEHEDFEVQVDGLNAAVLSAAPRNADWIERIHDGSFISQGFKLGSMTVLGLGVVAMIVSGVWLYYGPRRYRAERRSKSVTKPAPRAEVNA